MSEIAKCAHCGDTDPLFGMMIKVTLQDGENIVTELLCPCCSTIYDQDARLLSKESVQCEK